MEPSLNLGNEAIRGNSFVVRFLLVALSPPSAQDWIRTGTGLGVEKIRLAAPDFKAITTDSGTQNLATTFNTTLGNDLQAAGIFDMVSRSFYPMSIPGAPQDVHLTDWSSPPPNASMLAFGNLGVQGGYLNVQGWLYDTKNPQSPQVLGKQYREEANDGNARLIAHRFADEIIFRLGGGIQDSRDQDLFRQCAQRLEGNLADGLRRRRPEAIDAFGIDRVVAACFAGWFARGIFRRDQRWLANSDVLARAQPAGQLPPFRRRQLFAGVVVGRTEPCVFVFAHRQHRNLCGQRMGANVRRLTENKGPDVSPTWNPKTNAQIAWVSGRTGLPQIYTMASDGTNAGRVTDQGYAVSPSWSPNGQFLAFAWVGIMALARRGRVTSTSWTWPANNGRS